LDTQMVLLDALRIFDERNKDGRAGTPAQGTGKVAPPSTKSAPTPALGVQPLPKPVSTPVPLDAAHGRVRLQVCSSDKQIAEKLAQAMPEANVVRVNLRDAGTPPPGEPPPIVLLDLRQGAVALEAIAGLRRARPRASILAVIDAGVPVAQVYQAGAVNA